jgi:outer membrane protein assembly factor BamE (lipoprotein component of BamABCDE complex)
MSSERRWVVAMALCAVAALAGCSAQHADDAQQSSLTPGMVKLKVVKGQTTQAEIMEVFGPPDLVTHKDDMDIWTYDKTSYDYESQSNYLTVLFAGAAGDRVRSSSRSTMLIVYFDKSERVLDYRLSAIKY